MSDDEMFPDERCDLCGVKFRPNLRADQWFYIRHYKPTHCRHCATPDAIASGHALAFEQHMKRLSLPLPPRNPNGTYPVQQLDEESISLLGRLFGSHK